MMSKKMIYFVHEKIFSFKLHTFCYILIFRSNPANQNLSYLDKFSKENFAFIKTFDFIRDLAVEEPGDSPFLSARLITFFLSAVMNLFLVLGQNQLI